VLGLGLVLGFAMVLGLAHFTFCYASSPQKPASPHFTHSLQACDITKYVLLLLLTSYTAFTRRIFFTVKSMCEICGSFEYIDVNDAHSNDYKL